MRASEAIRIYQATLEARRAAWVLCSVDESEEMNAEVKRAKRAMEIAVLNEVAT